MLLLANVVWPALYLVDRMVAVDVIVLGLIVESAVFCRMLKVSWHRATVMSIAINLVSSIVGSVILPVWGWYWANATLNRDRAFGWGTFNPLSWAETCCFAWLLTTLLEWLPLALMVGKRRHLLWSLLAANFLSVGIAYISFSFIPPSQDPWLSPLVGDWLW